MQMEKDFTICVLSQRFRTNRQCLQNASDFFAIMFASTCWRESSQDHVELHDIDPETVQEVIDFCEKSLVSISKQNAIRLLAASDLLQVRHLKKQVERYFFDQLRLSQDVPATFTIANTYNCLFLKESCIKLATWCFDRLVETLSTSDYELVQCLVKNEFLHADENLVYKAIIAVTRGRIVDEVAPLIDELFLQNLTQPLSESLQLLHSLTEDSPTRKGFRKDAVTVGFISDNNALYAWDRRSSKLKRITTLPTRAVGCIIVHLGQFLYLLGGEGRIGCGNWNMDVYRFDNLHKSWDVVQRMDTERRSCQTLVGHEKIIMCHGYGKYRVELDTISVFDPSSGRWFHIKYSLNRIPGPPCKTVVFLDNCFYHLVDTSIVYCFSDEMFDLSSSDVLKIETTMDTITHAFPLDHQILILTTKRLIILWNPSNSRTEHLQLMSPDCEFSRCTLIDRTIYSVDFSENEITEFIVDLETKILKRTFQIWPTQVSRLSSLSNVRLFRSLISHRRRFSSLREVRIE
ncbi:kelch-like protein 17 isoform X3 [Varroa jacobsoni]|uniref:kelch-like protein 17 isoform X3 n=1 Tax=Varroa jacobsoni TaxID=62625 RepID=UPI000BF72381|nr:kelch-like protein 17 isoform X3 [Varroa jacobsoni]XP_022706400.1 kelch-like protein 17 isoform X3 [Varroa jacobsoni]